MVFVYRPEYKSIDELSQKEMRLGGLRVNPYLNIGSRTTYYNKVKILRLKKGDKSPIEVKGLPINFRNYQILFIHLINPKLQ